MKTRIVRCDSVKIPFKTKFAHHSAVREETETIVVQITNENKITGLGEACPRVYVTGETIQSAQAFIAWISGSLNSVTTLSDLIKLKNEQTLSIDKNPSAWCALEMAILDLLSREMNSSVDTLLNLEKAPTSAPYTAVLGIDSLGKFLIKLTAYKILKFHDFKIKLSGNQSQDLRRIKIASWFSSKIRVDANNLFKTSQEAIHYLSPIQFLIWAVEEPVSANDFIQMKEIALALKTKIILDESFLNEKSLESIKGMPNHFIPNLRISKLGGVLRTIELIKKLEHENFSWILGSHVGEMSLLTRASLLFTQHSAKGMLAAEGGFSTHLLKYDPFFPNLKIGFKATIKNRNLVDNVGWGMSFNNIKEEK